MKLKPLKPCLFEGEMRPGDDEVIYVGDIEYPFRDMLMSHMAAPNIEALHKFAEKLGLKRKWFQDSDTFPHYDICKSKKKLAIKLGAVEVSDRQLCSECYTYIPESF